MSVQKMPESAAIRESCASTVNLDKRAKVIAAERGIPLIEAYKFAVDAVCGELKRSKHEANER